MDELAREILAGEEAWIVGGAVRDELLGRDVIDLDIACRDPQGPRASMRSAPAALRFLSRSGTEPGASPSRPGGRWTSRRCPGAIEDDLATRDFTINAIALPLAGGDAADPYGGRGDIEQKVVRAVSARVSSRTTRCGSCARCGSRTSSASGWTPRRSGSCANIPSSSLDRRASGFWRELVRLSRRVSASGRARSACSARRLERRARARRARRLGPPFGWSRSSATRSFASRSRTSSSATRGRCFVRSRPETDRCAPSTGFGGRPSRGRSTRLVFVGATEHAEAVREARESDPAEPLLRGDELGLPPGPEIGRLLELVEEERAAGEISTREEALELVRREQRT